MQYYIYPFAVAIRGEYVGPCRIAVGPGVGKGNSKRGGKNLYEQCTSQKDRDIITCSKTKVSAGDRQARQQGFQEQIHWEQVAAEKESRESAGQATRSLRMARSLGDEDEPEPSPPPVVTAASGAGRSTSICPRWCRRM